MLGGPRTVSVVLCGWGVYAGACVHLQLGQASPDAPLTLLARKSVWCVRTAPLPCLRINRCVVRMFGCEGQVEALQKRIADAEAARARAEVRVPCRQTLRTACASM